MYDNTVSFHPKQKPAVHNKPAVHHTGTHIFIQNSTATNSIQEVQKHIWSLGDTKVRPFRVVEVKYHTWLIILRQVQHKYTTNLTSGNIATAWEYIHTCTYNNISQSLNAVKEDYQCLRHSQNGECGTPQLHHNPNIHKPLSYLKSEY